MTIALLEYSLSSQNHRVAGFEVPGDEQPRIFSTENILSETELDDLVKAAYRQIFNEQQMLKGFRQRFLESQLKAGQITVKDFIRGLALSDSFRRLVYDSNNNYRFVEICVQRVLGRNIYSDREKLAWSIVLGQQGLNAFIDALLDSEEYLSNFGDTVVPFQRRRILPQRLQGEVSFAHMARYGTDYRDQLPQPYLTALRGPGYTGPEMSAVRWKWQKQPSKVLQVLWLGLFFSGSTFILLLFLATLFRF
ncbi:MAG: phycobilisome rod-core linker polypeptide CpcG [Leptolyngbya sp. SIOISBB]|nr:phycobilisome rod-core linker polypeptide CpcG [Leptolyngbya sp. SIOISBB]